MKRLAFAVALLIGLNTASQADYRDGVAAYLRGDYATALHELKPLAEQGNSDARFILGFMYANGHGITRKRRSGTARPPNGDMPLPRPISASCTTRAGASHRTMPRR